MTYRIHNNLRGEFAMKRKTKKIIASMGVIILMVLLAGCGKSNIKKEILGKWEVIQYESIGSSQNTLENLQDMLLASVFAKSSKIEFINDKKMSLMMNSVECKSSLNERRLKTKPKC